MPNQDWIWIRDGEIPTLDVDPLYDVFSRFSLPPGLLTWDLTHALSGKIDSFPSPIAAVYGAILRVAVDEWSTDLGRLRVECWSSRSWKANREVQYHVDNDEAVRRRTGTVLMPVRGLIYYVGPDESRVGGTYFNPPIERATDEPNLFCNPVYDEVVNGTGALVPFLPGRLVLFDGRCPHCVAPFKRLVNPRVAILANFWHK